LERGRQKPSTRSASASSRLSANVVSATVASVISATVGGRRTALKNLPAAAPKEPTD